MTETTRSVVTVIPWHIFPLLAITLAMVSHAALAATTTGPATQPAVIVTDIPKVSGIQVKDSVSDWQGQGLEVRALAGESAGLRKAGDFQTIGRLGWSPEGLLLHVDVTDATPFEAPNLDHLFEGDSVELFLMRGENDKTGMIQLVASPGRTNQQNAPRYKLFDYREREFKKDIPAFTPRVAVNKTDRGYAMDLLLPWESMKIKPELDTVLRVGFTVNDGTGQGDQDRQRAIWINHLAKAEWMKLPSVRLAEKPSTADSLAAWAGYDDFQAGYFHAVADPAFAGRKIEVLEAGKSLVQGELVRDGERATASLRFPVPPVGQKHGELTVLVDGKPVRTVPMPDLEQLRKNIFLAGGTTPFDRNGFPSWAKVGCRSEVFVGEALPVCDYPEPDRIRELVGPYTLKTDYFDADFNQVEKAAKPGRYGAVTTVTTARGDSFTANRTLFRAATEQEVKPGVAAYLLAAAPTPGGKSDPFLAAKADRDWWHNLCKKLGTAIKYEYYARLPKKYDEDPAQRWPVIFYLHGSGGGVTMEGVQNNAVQIPAREQADFPFLTVSLRSPGGWYPPAVKDVIAEVTAKYRTDPRRYYLTGFSMGGMGTWAVVLDHPDCFAAIAPVGGRSGDQTQAERIKHIPAWVINGADDVTTSSADALQMVRALQAVGAEVKWTEIPGAGHVESHDIAYSWPELYAWFLAHHR